MLPRSRRYGYALNLCCRSWLRRLQQSDNTASSREPDHGQLSADSGAILVGVAAGCSTLGARICSTRALP